MRISKLSAALVFACLWFVTMASAITFEMTDGVKLEGEIFLVKDEFLQIRAEGGSFPKIEWSKFSQTTLNELKKNPKLAQIVEPYIEVPLDEKIKKTEVAIKEVPRLERPPKGSILGAMFSSSVGIVCLLLLYGANIYAGYEIAVVRAYPPAMVCGVAAVAPIIGPVIFLCLPTKMPPSEDELAEQQQEQAAPAETYSASYGGAAAPHTSSSEGESQSASASHSAAVPQTQSFKRGQFTFNRRFIETKFAGFFGMVRKDAEKDLLLIIKSARGEFAVTRISEIGATDLKVDVHAGGASQQVHIPFVEILEMQIKHKDA